MFRLTLATRLARTMSSKDLSEKVRDARPGQACPALPIVRAAMASVADLAKIEA